MATQMESTLFEPELRDLSGKVAIISGGTTGIGRATAGLLAKKGVKVVIYGRHEQPLQDAMNDLKRIGGDHMGLTADQAQEDQIVKVFAETKQRFGDIDILVNNAALAAGSALDTDYEQMEYVLRTNLLGYLVSVREAVRMMERKGEGHIVNIGSMSSTVREVGSDIYVATKAGIEGLSESLRKQLGEKNIRLSLIEPGKVSTNLVSDQPDPEKQQERELEGMSLAAADIAHAVYYVLSQPDRSNIAELRIIPAKQPI